MVFICSAAFVSPFVHLALFMTIFSGHKSRGMPQLSTTLPGLDSHCESDIVETCTELLSLRTAFKYPPEVVPITLRVFLDVAIFREFINDSIRHLHHHALTILPT
jgi:hypothetical protein